MKEKRWLSGLKDKLDVNQPRTLVQGPAELIGALEEACAHCACSVGERLDGHLFDCPVPRWRELIGRASVYNERKMAK